MYVLDFFSYNICHVDINLIIFLRENKLFLAALYSRDIASFARHVCEIRAHKYRTKLLQ